jgi:hypothetical protein
LLAAALATSALMLAGCAVGGEKHAVAIPSGDLPSALLGPADSSPAPAVSSSGPPAAAPSSIGTAARAKIYLVDDTTKTLVAVHRPQGETSSLTGLITDLLKGPTEAESAAGLTTAINTGPTLNHVTVEGSEATIDLSASFGDIRTPGEILATAQVVMTAVTYPGIDSVQFTLDGTPTAVPLVSGVLAPGPFTYFDYASLLAGAASFTPRA